MTDQTANDSAVIPYARKARNAATEADQLDRAGHAILGLVSRAADTTEADLRAARQAAEKLADQLKAANNQINAILDCRFGGARDRCRRLGSSA